MAGIPSTWRHCLPLLQHLARAGQRRTEDALAPEGLRPRHLIALTVLNDHGPASQLSLAETLALDPSNVVGVLNDLEQRAYVTRRRDPADRRRHIVEISAAGRQALTTAQNHLAGAEDDLLKALTTEERATLYELLARATAGQRPGVCDEAE
jgi:DNA-binding MarR family transcriptional regulator